MDCELAYLAGYFDGEGTVTILKYPRGYAIRVSLGNTYEPAVLAFQSRFGGGVVSHQSARKNTRRFWEWQAHGENAYTFLITILPFLHEKAAQAEEAVEFYRLYGNHTFQRGIGRTAEEKADQEMRFLHVRSLKYAVA